MPNAIDLGDGLIAEITEVEGGGNEIRLADELVEDPIDMTFDQFDKLVAFVAAHREGK